MNKKVKRIIIIAFAILIVLFLLNIVRRDANCVSEGIIEEIKDKVIHKEIDSNSDEDNSNKPQLISSDLTAVEVSIEDEESTTGINYLDPQKINNKEILSKVKYIINSSTLYPEEEFVKKYGEGDYLEGCPILNVYDSESNVYCVVPVDNFKVNENDSAINIMTIYKVGDESNKSIYKTTSNFEEFVTGLYSK